MTRTQRPCLIVCLAPTDRFQGNRLRRTLMSLIFIKGLIDTLAVDASTLLPPDSHVPGIGFPHSVAYHTRCIIRNRVVLFYRLVDLMLEKRLCGNRTRLLRDCTSVASFPVHFAAVSYPIDEQPGRS